MAPPPPVDLSHILPFEATFFDDALPVERNELDIPALLGVDDEVPDELLVSLCGALTGSTIEAYLEDTTRLTFEVTNPTFIASTNKVSIIRRADGDVLELGKIDLVDDTIPGLGAVMLWRIVRACDALGISRITAYAVGGRKAAVVPGGPRLSGYYAWPRFGFDAAIPHQSGDEAALFQYFPGYPDGLADGRLQSLRALFGARLGRYFWRVAGTDRWMTFDVAPQSQSVLTLENYLKEKGIYG
ncbi:hypothetical protein BLA18110_07936 [Burkholderia lata]|uniref:hypothetical protein n=1 Tax=Burkholderia lata (strain ATCC 17760 / DSM 23089 / LMG 22485 / NCIMB 9086 / R18194 / 383) TaxID=482957 RepID=UPI001453113A|nr:hypothetical protein [Burkholderia lata]VWD54286.1 hypothetical protein BLA18110_07936 [Burkholderia lata]